MNLIDIQKNIDATKYWDLWILDIQIKYFGDQVDIFIENSVEKCWRISFFNCYKVDYETDANWRGTFKVKDSGPKSGYYGQDIFLRKYAENEDFIESSLDFSIMTMRIVCKDIAVEEVAMKDTSFFWNKKE